MGGCQEREMRKRAGEGLMSQQLDPTFRPRDHSILENFAAKGRKPAATRHAADMQV